jgi:long-chain acyl-CoA synthetase
MMGLLPIFHGFGMSVGMNTAIISGATCILLPRYDLEELLKAIHRFRPTLFAGVPTIYNAMINHPRLARYNLSSLRACYVGAAPLSPEIKLRFEELTGARLMEGYGLTEAVTAICANPYRGINKTGSIGIPFPDVVIKVMDAETGQKDLPPGEVGELVTRCKEVMLGYYNRPGETAEVLKEGWLYTGDLGYMDEEGYFYIVDRKKDLIITGGFNVYPREVEDVLYQHPGVNETSVIGVPDKYRGETVKAFVTLKEGCDTSAEEIVLFCRQHLLPYKVPRQVEICRELPKSAIGKILKKTLRELPSGDSEDDHE